MPLSYEQYPGDGSNRDFPVTFPYLVRSHVRVFIGYDPAADTWTSELLEGTEFAWISGTLIKTTTAPSGAQQLSVVRKTPTSSLIVQWQDGSNFSAQDLLPSDLQNLYALQEQLDRTNAVAAQARSAVDTANNIFAAVSSIVAYQFIANVATIPSSPADDTYIEVADSTGIQSFTPLAGLPGGFTGSAGLSVRLRYTTAGATWNWLAYFPNDPESRYLSLAGGTLTGPLTLPDYPMEELEAATKHYVDGLIQLTFDEFSRLNSATHITAHNAFDLALVAMPRGGGAFTGDVIFASTQVIPVSGIPDGGIGTAKMADGFLAATTAGRLKMADLFIITAKVGNAQITPEKLSQPLTLGTAQNSTSGTSINFTGIPSWVRRVTVMFNGVSTNGTSNYLVQLGTSGGVITTGYISTGNTVNQANGTAGNSSTAGLLIGGGVATYTLSGHMILTTLGSNVWVSSHCCKVATTNVQIGGGDVTLSGALNRIRITTVNGTDTFDGGSINILYEG